MKDTNNLFRVNEKEYGDSYREHLMTQYRLYVEGMEKTSDRRQNANNYFITINTVMISFLGVVLQTKVFDAMPWVKSLIALVGVIICIVFWFLLRSYKQLNTGKFKVIHHIEAKLPIALYDFEWKELGEGKDRKLYSPFSHIEMTIPWVFGVVYIILGILFFTCH